MAGETGKQRGSRIELTYYRRPDALALRRRALAALALTGAAAWLALAPHWDRNRDPRWRLFQWDRMASPGALAHAHAAWTDDCAACHPPFAPVNASRWSPLPAREPRAADALCQRCHEAAGHHPVRAAAEIPSCAECHRDHRGPDARLARSPDSTCTRCHADLAGHRLDRPTVVDRVTAFDAKHHPQFAAIGKPDPGRLAFNHALHLAPGLTLQQGGRPWTLARLPESQRARYAPAGSTPDSSVTLKCADCHAPDASGASMRPVSYETHCAACHPLTFDPALPDRQVTHGLNPAEIVGELRGLYAQAVVSADDTLLARRVADRPLPRRSGDAVDRSAAEALDTKLTAALRLLLGAAPAPGAKQAGCLECHEVATAPATIRGPEDYAAIGLAPTNVPSVWLPGARFNHHAHRAWDCISCHAAAVRSTTHRDLLLPDRDDCVTCHAPSRTESDGTSRGGVDHSCTECHTYHQVESSTIGLSTPS
jgi:hypothetical protein